MVAPMLLRRASSKAMLAPRHTLRLKQSLAGQLPPEVLLMILAHLRPTRNPEDAFHGDDIPHVDLALAGAPRVCRAWTAAAMYELYLEVPLPDFEACISFLRTVKARPALTTRVHRVALPLCSTSRDRDGHLATHRARHCPAIKVFSDILHHLPGVRALRVQDMHVIMIPGTLVHMEELVIDSRPAACVVVHAGCPPLLRAGDALRRVRNLTLLGSPSAIAWPCQEEYHLPALRVLCLRFVTAGLAAIHGLLQETRRTLRQVTLDAVRAYAGTVPARASASIDEILVPVCETLRCLALARMPRRAGLDAFPRLESLSLDVQEDFDNLPLPPNLRHLDIHVDDRNLAPSPYKTFISSDPCQSSRAVWDMLAQRRAPDLESVTLHVEVDTGERFRSWKLASLLLEKTCAHVDLRCSANIRISHRTPVAVHISTSHGKLTNSKANRVALESIRKLMKRTVTA